jgi:gamma-resorcylate decarboxylase
MRVSPDYTERGMLQGKIALEEHVMVPAAGAPGAFQPARVNDPEYFADVHKRLSDSARRLEEMDRCGIELMVLSLTQPGVQALTDAAKAVEVARRINDELAERFVAAYPRRFAAFASLPMQDIAAAGDELERAVKQLGFKGAMINGYSNIGDPDSAQYLDEAPVWEFWARVAELDVPIYLHPRDPLPSQRRIYDGYPVLIGSAWGFGVETAGHTLRLMLSGLFDRFAGLKIVLGHLGEGLPFLLPRVEHRLRHATLEGSGAAKKSLTEYLCRNFYLTTSGAFRSTALIQTLLEVGSDRVLFSIDYPYETMQEQSEWFETVPLGNDERYKIARDNALRVLRLERD